MLRAMGEGQRLPRDGAGAGQPRRGCAGSRVGIGAGDDVGVEQVEQRGEIAVQVLPMRLEGVDHPVTFPLRGGTGSRVTFTLDFEGDGLGIPLVPGVRRQAQKAAPTSYENLKSLLEREGSPR